MNIIVSHEQARVPITVFRIEGRINLGNAHALREKAQEEFEHGMRDLLIDLTAVPSMTTEGLRALHSIYLLLGDVSPEQRGEGIVVDPSGNIRTSPHLKLLNPSPHLRHMLSVAGFVDFIELHNDRQAALASF